MKRTKRKRKARVLRSWTAARKVLERWRRAAAQVRVELKRPRDIDGVPVDFIRGERTESAGKPQQKFRGRLIYFTSADVTIRRSSGAILAIDNYEIASLSDRKTRLEPR